MARISRSTQVIFGSAGLVPTGGFGAPAAGNIATEMATSSSLSTLQGLTAWPGGWLDATLGASKFPTVEDMNAFNYTVTTQLAYLLQQGIPEYDASTNYFQKNIVVQAGTLKLFASVTNNNEGNALTDITNWEFLIDLAVQRIRLAGAATYYVATTGNDSNPGTVGSPWLTVQHALTWCALNLDFNGNTVTIQIADGTYTNSGNTLGFPIVGASYGNLVVQGNLSNASSVVISAVSGDAFYAAQSSLSLQYMTLQTATSGDCIAADVGALVEYNNIIFGACAANHVNAFKGGQIVTRGNYGITGGAQAHWVASNSGVIQTTAAITITLTGTPAFSGAFAIATQSGNLNAAGITFSGGATGQRYNASLNGNINTNGGGATFFPGSVGGATATGGQYA